MDSIDFKQSLALAQEALLKECSTLFALFGAQEGSDSVTLPVKTATRFYQVNRTALKKRTDLSGTNALLFGKSTDLGLNAKKWNATGEASDLGIPGVKGTMRAVPGNPEQYEIAFSFDSYQQMNEVEASVFDLFQQNAESQKKVILFNPKPFSNIEGSGKAFTFNPTCANIGLITNDENADILSQIMTKTAEDAMTKYASLLKFCALSADNTKRLRSGDVSSVYKVEDEGITYYGCGSDVNTELFMTAFYAAYADCLSAITSRVESCDDFATECYKILEESVSAKDSIAKVNGPAFRRSISLFSGYGIFTPEEIKEISDCTLNKYIDDFRTDLEKTLDITWRVLLPAVNEYSGALAATAANKKALIENIDCGYEAAICAKISAFTRLIVSSANTLEEAISQSKDMVNEGYLAEVAEYFGNEISPVVEDLHYIFSELEAYIPPKRWPAL